MRQKVDILLPENWGMRGGVHNSYCCVSRRGNMHSWIRLGFVALAGGMLFAGIARLNADDADISDGPSRQELFEARLAAELGPLGALSAAAAPPFFLPTDAKD